jgi:nickel-dependent lactate racemase
VRLPFGTSELPAPPARERPADVTPLVPAVPAVPAGDGPGDAADAVESLAAAVVALADSVGTPDDGGATLILVPDRTRAFPLASALASLLARLVARGHAAERLTVMIASGTHRAADADTDPARLGALPGGVRVVTHDADGPGAAVGTTPAGTPVRVHPALLAHARVLALSGTAYHYFAGFGGGPKMLFPGVAAREGIALNHARALGPWPPGGLAPGVEPGRLAGNPVAEDLAAAARLLPRAAHVTAWRDAGGTWRARRWSAPEEFPLVCALAERGRRVGVAFAFDAAWASAGGAPRDLDVVQAHKALFHAARYVKDGGRIVFAAAAREGYGSAAVERWLGRPDRATLEAEARTAYDLNAQTAISLAAIAARIDVTWIAERPLPLLARWGVRVVPAADAATTLHEEARRLAGARVAWLPAAADVWPATVAPGARLRA